MATQKRRSIKQKRRTIKARQRAKQSYTPKGDKEKEETRTIYLRAIIKMQCCRDGKVRYNPEPQEFKRTITQTGIFDTSLVLWRDLIIEGYEDYHKERARDECTAIAETGSIRLCTFEADWGDTETEVEYH